MKTMLCSLLLAMLLPAGLSRSGGSESFRVIPIPKRENGYSNFASIAFMSRDEFDSFVKRTSTQIGWNNRKEFEDALRSANVDFAKEALVLLRHTEPSGSVQVTFETPTLERGKLVCEIRGKAIPPGFLDTGDMAFYGFAVAVSKSAVTQVELRAVEGGFHERRLAPIVFPITAKEPSNSSLDRGAYASGFLNLIRPAMID